MLLASQPGEQAALLLALMYLARLHFCLHARILEAELLLALTRPDRLHMLNTMHSSTWDAKVGATCSSTQCKHIIAGSDDVQRG
eukprot:1160114-Pelagomonas_calceolata.AAC.1